MSALATRLLGSCLLCASLLAPPAFAAWELDGERSRVGFVSVKNASIAEVHHFRAVTGSVDDDGQVNLAIDLDSVETLIPIRNQRMRELLFETVRFPAAKLATTVDASLLALTPGSTALTELEFTVDLHGNTRTYTAQVLVTGSADGGFSVALQQPLIVRAADFGLEAGIEVLREVAGLASISKAVPVDVRLVFVPAM